MDPALAARFARQKEKLERGDDVVEIGSQADHKKQLDPVLAQRWEKLQTGEVPKCVVNDDIGSIADKTVKLDPVLAKRWSKQQERMDDNYVCEIPDVVSLADKSTKIDPVLAERWAAKNERFAGFTEGEEIPEVGSRADFSRKDTELAKTFAKMQKQAKRGSGEAERCQLQFSAGQQLEQTAPWGADGRQGRLQWSAVVLSDLTIDLEVRAVVRTPPETEGSEGVTEQIVLQRNARGVTFVGTLDASCDRRLGATAGDKKIRKEVLSVIFKFSNSFSWFTGKEVELVLLKE
ncbi:unnamed protein product [Cladocopium goreaui]|uniref:Pre-mRNA-splicing factor SLU7 n=2 Tax=Cladocopium goreaui TaxID=2562237 RepID=A0A9P1BX96_9DINO|nr:unnamed protein product [Cladocopium goreaui]